MKHLISLDGNNNQVAFVRGNDGDIHISFDIPSKQILWESVRVGVGNSGGQRVPGYVKDALIKVCEAMEKWEQGETQELLNDEELDKYLAEIKRDYNNPYHFAAISIGVNYFDKGFKAGYGYNKAKNQ